MKTLKISIICISFLLFIPNLLSADVFRKKFTTATAYLIIEVLDDDLIHVEVSSAGSEPSIDRMLYTSPMIHKTDYTGPSFISDNTNTIETNDIKIEIDPKYFCMTFKDKTKGDSYLTTICPRDLNKAFKGFNVDPGSIQHVYGLGQEFKNRGSSDGDWTTLGVRQGLWQGNGFQGFQEAAVGNVQIPVMYAVGKDYLNYVLFVDNIYKQTFDFTKYWWEMRMFGDQLRFYIMTGPNLIDLRADYMELTGTPPVPPRKSFGMWISEFGYDNWNQIDDLKTGLRNSDFPFDGFVLDLNWFGGVNLNDSTKSRMGKLDWDKDNNDGNGYYFPNPDQRIQQYAADHIGLTAIEESYINHTTDTYSQMPADFSTYERTNQNCDENNQTTSVTDVDGFWGKGRMIDWSDPDACIWIHNNRRYPNLVQKGITCHWTDLGEPECFKVDSCYEGVERTSQGLKNEHSDIHNVYNLLWNKSIWDGYYEKRGQQNNLGQTNPRPFILTRSGACGTQRYGAAMWSGDIAANLESLATHSNAQMHMSFSGIDYYGADVGGFRREVLPYNDKDGRYRGYENEMYTQWFANACWFDVPVRPHTDNEFVKVSPPYATSPHLVGNLKSNLANIRQRYELIPYYYSLAYRAHLFGEPVVPPLVFYEQNDPNVRKIGHEKFIGKSFLIGIVAFHGEYERDVYLPAGKWINYHTNEWFSSSGKVFDDIPVYRNGVFRLPAFVRSGSIIPQMHVDSFTKDAFGNLKGGASGHSELMVQVYPDMEASTFTLYEDDGVTLNYHNNRRPFYQYRETKIDQIQTTGAQVNVTIHPAHDINTDTPFNGAIIERRNVIKLVMENAEATTVSLNGSHLTQYPNEMDFNAAPSGWYNAGNNLVIAKSDKMNVYSTTKQFSFALKPIPATTSVCFVCDRGVTVPGESIYVIGNIPIIGGPTWDSTKAIKLDPNIYHEYIVNPPPGHLGPGPSEPVWSGVISGIPSNTVFEWKCIRKSEDGTGEIHWQPGENNSHHTTATGYAGMSYGSF